MNHYDVRVQSAQDGTKLLPLLRRSFPMAPEWELLKSLKTRDVKVDGRRVTQNETVSAGQIVEWYTMWAAQEIPVVYEDGNLLILAKPAGLNTDGHATGIMTLLAWAEARAAGERDPYRPRLVHRLDNQTYGLIMLAKNDQAEEALSAALKERSIIKTYTCLVGGSPKPAQAVLKDYLLKDAASAKVGIYSKPVAGSKEIITEYRVLKAGDEFSRLEVTLHTGRTHQIRAHLAYKGYPLLGDDKYGDYALNKRLRANWLMLAATQLTFHTGGYLSYLDGSVFTLEAPF